MFRGMLASEVLSHLNGSWLMKRALLRRIHNEANNGSHNLTQSVPSIRFGLAIQTSGLRPTGPY